jgi:DNA cross-link repair 1A protein
MKVYVDARRMRIFRSLEWNNSELDRLTTKPGETNLWVVPLGHINMKKLEGYLATRTADFDRVIGFRPTGWTLSKKGSSIVTTNSRDRVAVHNVPYSEHSAFPELVDCLQCLKPKRIIPTVAVAKSQEQVDLLLSQWKR